MRVVEHSFGWNTSNVQACSAKCPTLFYTRDLWGDESKQKAEYKYRTHPETELSGLDGSNVSTRSCKRNNVIKVADKMAARTSTDNDSIIWAASRQSAC